MTTARASCTCRTCGMRYTEIATKRNRAEADAWEAWASSALHECDKCREARIQRERNEQNELAIEIARELNYPDLIGTPRQVKWANTLRQEAMEDLREKFMDAPQDSENEFVYSAMKELLLDHKHAGWWIDNRGYLKMPKVRRHIKDFEPDRYALFFPDDATGSTTECTATSTPTPSEMPRAKRAEAIPEDCQKESSVELLIEMSGRSPVLLAIYQKDNDFMEVVRKLGFRWRRSAWLLEIDERTGNAENAEASAGNALLESGFAVSFDNEEIRNKAVGGDFEPISTLWISGSADSGNFRIFVGSDKGLFKKARRIPGAEYSGHFMGYIIPSRSWRELYDLSKTDAFRYSQEANEMMEQKRGVSMVVSELVNPEGDLEMEIEKPNENGILPSLLDD